MDIFDNYLANVACGFNAELSVENDTHQPLVRRLLL